MDRETLATQLAAGRSIESIAREAGRAPSTVAYWVNKHGLTSQHATRHAPRGGIEREQARGARRRKGFPIRRSRHDAASARRRSDTGCSGTSLKTRARRTMRRPRRRASPARRLVRECSMHGLASVCSASAPLAITAARGAIRRPSATGVGESRRFSSRKRGERASLCGFDALRRRACSSITAIQPTKAFEVSRQGITRSLERLRLEARKCVLLCANCHAMVEAGRAESADVATR